MSAKQKPRSHQDDKKRPLILRRELLLPHCVLPFTTGLFSRTSEDHNRTKTSKASMHVCKGTPRLGECKL
ncbi:hypothetical protein AV530_015681 [Patagioenas fasciata monilis]|uniref:Uncharacterized protein n=1 Tax=Patagioenas fasciata monilis TaxID=372326 RepID=A0A1V4KIF7_PATFA|nr:hypothetical protein AV530_015681 [Patagioenas fasciata monilis]